MLSHKIVQRFFGLLPILLAAFVFAGGIIDDTSAYMPKSDTKGPIHTLVCGGNLRVHLDGKAKQDKSYKKLHKNVIISEKNGVLMLRGMRNKNHHADVIIAANSLPHLEEIRVLNACGLEANHVKLAKLRLLSRTKADIKLYGEFGAYAIDQAGSNNLEMLWVDADEIDVTMHGGTMQLAGIGSHARVRVSGDSKLHLRHLRMDDLWLVAAGNAFVDLYSAGHLSSFIRGNAKVVAHKRPEMLSDISKDSAILVFEP